MLSSAAGGFSGDNAVGWAGYCWNGSGPADAGLAAVRDLLRSLGSHPVLWGPDSKATIRLVTCQSPGQSGCRDATGTANAEGHRVNPASRGLQVQGDVCTHPAGSDDPQPTQEVKPSGFPATF